MKDLPLLCLGCMRKKPNEGICPYCGFDAKNYIPPVYHLELETILFGKYLLGKSLGQGGFGITYIGWDINLQIPVAIKEYFPDKIVMRDSTKSNYITVFTKNKEAYYIEGKEKCLEEARRLAQLNGTEGIVEVRDFFQENGTVYIVMEYLDGKNLQKIMEEMESRQVHMQSNQVFEIMRPVIQALELVHEHGLVHRDISPDNIIMLKNKKMKLIDFGAARDFLANNDMSVFLKIGYAPEEQYRTNSEQGPWTDVYALCATMYRMITGKKPLDSISRRDKDSLKKPSELGIDIDPNIENVLMRGMAVDAKYRIRSMRELYGALYEKTYLGNDGLTVVIPREKKTVSEDSTIYLSENLDGSLSNSTTSLLVIWGILVIIAIAVIIMIIFILYQS